MKLYDDVVGYLDTRIRSSVARLNVVTSASMGYQEVTLVKLDGDGNYHVPVELGGSGGMLRKTSCWKCTKGLKMIIKEKMPSLKLYEKSLPASDTT
ncbi:hypothetical protein Hanom_Chr15g01386801 [Helianthus anomalus]